MSGHVQLNFLSNDLKKRDKMRTLPSMFYCSISTSLTNSIPQGHGYKILFIIYTKINLKSRFGV